MKYAAALALLAVVLHLGLNSPVEATQPTCTVERVIDGDTFVCTNGVHVRMLQMNAQELSDCGGEWAKAALQYIVLPAGITVQLEYDRMAQDKYGRDLAAPIFVRPDGSEYNASIVMVYAGLAKAAYYGDNAKYLAWARAAEDWARVAQWNMWAPGGPYNGATNCGTFPAPPAPAPTAPSVGSCDAAYPDFCIPPPPPDLDCGDIGRKNFTVLPPDPHGFDGDHDGIGCET